MMTWPEVANNALILCFFVGVVWILVRNQYAAVKVLRASLREWAMLFYSNIVMRKDKRKSDKGATMRDIREKIMAIEAPFNSVPFVDITVCHKIHTLAIRAASDIAEAEVQRLEEQLAESEKINFHLASWQCPFTDGKKGLVNAENGDQYCEMERNVQRLEDENERLRSALADQLVDDTLMRELVVKAGNMHLEMEGGVCKLLAESFAELLVKHNAENYIEASFTSKLFLPEEFIVVTVQKTSGKTPHQLRHEADIEVQRMEARVRELENNSIFESKKLRELSTFFGVACPESDEELFNQSWLILGHILRAAKQVIGG